MLSSAKVPSGSILTLSYPFTVILFIPQASKIDLDTGPVTLELVPKTKHAILSQFLVFQQAALILEGQVSELGLPQWYTLDPIIKLRVSDAVPTPKSAEIKKIIQLKMYRILLG